MPRTKRLHRMQGKAMSKRWRDVNNSGIYEGSVNIDGENGSVSRRKDKSFDDDLNNTDESAHCNGSYEEDGCLSNDSIGVNLDRSEIEELFWNDLYASLANAQSKENDSRSQTAEYKDEVIRLLFESKSHKDSLDLETLQRTIEDLTMNYHEYNIHKYTPNMIKLMIDPQKLSAKEYLKNNLEPSYLPLLNQFGCYTLEAIMIQVLSLVFNCIKDFSVVRVSTFLHHLHSTVLDHARFMNTNKSGTDKKKEAVDKTKVRTKKGKISKEARDEYALGVNLMNFLVEREIIILTTDVGLSKENVVVKPGQGYIPKTLYVVCNFDISLLPIKLNLPMIYPPLDWAPIKKDCSPETLSDLRGGYLCSPSGPIYKQFRLLTSHDLDNFYIKLNNKEYSEMCDVLNGLQSQPFEINTSFLNFIEKNRDCLLKYKLLMPRVLAHVNLRKACDQLRYIYFSNAHGIKSVCSVNKLVSKFMSSVQQARFEDFVITLASAYQGYTIYLPAFMDFRGRVYRSGIIHFHERDLARSLLQFAQQSLPLNSQLIDTFNRDLACAAAFKYRKFITIDAAYDWYLKHESEMSASDESLIQFAMHAKDPFQFLAKVFFHKPEGKDKEYSKVPVTQDASASAYQIMSYLLLNVEIGRRTNLIPSEDRQIQDVYMCLKDELLHFIKDKMTAEKYAIAQSILTRKTVKGMFMPLIYGKTVFSMGQDLRKSPNGWFIAQYKGLL